MTLLFSEYRDFINDKSIEQCSLPAACSCTLRRGSSGPGARARTGTDQPPVHLHAIHAHFFISFSKTEAFPLSKAQGPNPKKKDFYCTDKGRRCCLGDRTVAALKSSWCKIASAAKIWINSISQLATTTFAFSSVFSLLKI